MHKKFFGILACTVVLAMSMMSCKKENHESGSALSSSEVGTVADSSETQAELTQKKADINVALITMDSVDEHWILLNEGAQEEAQKSGVNVDFISPSSKDADLQIEAVKEAVAGDYDAIMIAAVDQNKLSASLQEAKDKGIKLIYVDSRAEVEAEATFSTDNYAAGQGAARELLEVLEARGLTSGDIAIVGANADAESTTQRELGFRSVFEGSAYKILDTVYADGDVKKSEELAKTYMDAGAIAIFAANEGATEGAGNAVKSAGKDDVLVVGFDRSDDIMDLINSGHILFVMVQNPDVMGQLGVDAAKRAVEGEDLGGVITDTGVSLVTKP